MEHNCKKKSVQINIFKKIAWIFLQNETFSHQGLRVGVCGDWDWANWLRGCCTARSFATKNSLAMPHYSPPLPEAARLPDLATVHCCDWGGLHYKTISLLETSLETNSNPDKWFSAVTSHFWVQCFLILCAVEGKTCHQVLNLYTVFIWKSFNWCYHDMASFFWEFGQLQMSLV